MPKFPVILKKWGAELRIYPPSKTKNRYRVLFRLGSKRVERVYLNYAEAKREADAILRKIQTQGAHSLQLSNQEAREYLDLKLKASKRGMRVADVIADWSDATELLDDPRDLVNAARAHNRNKPKRLLTIEESVFNYIASRKGQVAQRTFYGVCQALERFSQSFACRLDQLTRSSIKAYIHALRMKRTGKAVSAKTRNIHREYIRGFLKWCNVQEYLGDGLYADLIRGLVKEKHRRLAEIAIHSPKELGVLMQNATGDLKLAVAIAAYSGLRTAEILKLEWSDVGPEFIVVRAENAKTRARRLIPITPALASILGGAQKLTRMVWGGSESKHRDQMAKLYRSCGLEKPQNVLRHSFISYRLALTEDEKKTAQEAGNTPDIIYQHYRALVTQKEAKQWFQIK